MFAQYMDKQKAHLPSWSLIPHHEPHSQPEQWADEPVLGVCKGLHLPMSSWRCGLACALAEANALHNVPAGAYRTTVPSANMALLTV